jgi:hypothetical protein
MSTPDTERGSSNGSTATTPSTQTRQLSQHRPWREPPEASKIAENARSLMEIKSTKKSWPQYPSRSSTPPPGLSFKVLCSNYPNHLDGELLVEMSDAGLRPRDIVEMMPADTRNLNLGTEWSWITERTKKAKLARGHRREEASQITPVRSEAASQSACQGISVKGEGSSRPTCQAAISVTTAKPVHETISPMAKTRSTSSSSVLSTPSPTPSQLGSKITTTLMTPTVRLSDSSSSVLPLAADAQLSRQVPKTIMTQNHRPGATTNPSTPAVTFTPFDRTTTARAIITGGGQFFFQESPPNTTPASQYTSEYRHKEALREEIRKQLKLLVDISSTAEGFISRSPQQQQNDILLQWKKWCDDQALTLSRRHGVFVGSTLTGFVIKDSLTRLLGTLTKIKMKEDGSGRAMVGERARSQALEYAEELLKQYTLDLQVRANHLFLPNAITRTASACSTAIATKNATNDVNAPRNRYGYYGIQLSAAALNLTQQSTGEAVGGTTNNQTSSAAGPSIAGPSTAPSSIPIQEHQQISDPRPSHSCVGCCDAKKRCDKVLPYCGNCCRSDRDCNYVRG